MSFHSYMTRRDAKDILAVACATTREEELNEYLEDVRQLIYSLYNEADIIPHIVRCFDVQCFCTDCEKCVDEYRGITLPFDQLTVEGLWYDHAHNQAMLLDDWRGWSPMISRPRDCSLVAEDVEGYFPTERDIYPCGCCATVKVMARDSQDAGKIVRLLYIDESGERVEDKIELKHGQYTCSSMCVCRFIEGGIVLPPNRCGQVIIAQQGYESNKITDRLPESEVGVTQRKGNDRVLSYYQPNESVPAYRRIRFTNIPDCITQVNVRSSRRYVPLINDHDPVETDNRMILQWLAKAVRLNRKDNIDTRDMQVSEAFIAKARVLMLGDKGRERGRHKNLRIMSPSAFSRSSNSLNRWR